MQSLVFLMIYLLKGTLPWNKFSKRFEGRSFEFLLKERHKIEYIKEFMRMVPLPLKSFVKEIILLKFEDEPDYNGIKTIIEDHIITIWKKAGISK